MENTASQQSQSNPHPRNEVGSHKKQGQALLKERSDLFGCTVADSLLLCNTKGWALIKKKVMDSFFEHEQEKLNIGNHMHAPFLPGSPPFQQQQPFTEMLQTSSHSSPSYQQQHQHTFYIMQNPNRYDFTPSNASNVSSYSNHF